MTTDPTLGLHSLATMARVLGRSQPLTDVLEVAAEGARLTLGAASVSISRYDTGDAALHTVINVGDLGPSEVRWPQDETYPVTRWPELAEVLRYGATRVDQREDPQGDPRERDLLTRLGKGSSVTASVIVDDHVWGEFYATRHVGQVPFGEQSVDYVEVLVALLGSAISRSLREADLVRQADR
jgi:GAF domain-containing protein